MDFDYKIPLRNVYCTDSENYQLDIPRYDSFVHL